MHTHTCTHTYAHTHTSHTCTHTHHTHAHTHSTHMYTHTCTHTHTCTFTPHTHAHTPNQYTPTHTVASRHYKLARNFITIMHSSLISQLVAAKHNTNILHAQEMCCRRAPPQTESWGPMFGLQQNYSSYIKNHQSAVQAILLSSQLIFGENCSQTYHEQ